MDEKLKSTLDKIIRLTQQNAEFDKSLRDALNLSYPVDNSIVSDERINQIYEYCIEKIIRKQAEEFYKDFPLTNVVTSLIEDFTRMESFRRKDSFGDFCLSLYQQIEGIINCLCEDVRVDKIAKSMWNSPAYVSNDSPSIINRNTKSSYTIAKLVFGKKEGSENSKVPLKDQTVKEKIRSIVYFICYGTVMKSSDYDNYIEITNILYDIYLCRNMNHRGNTPTPWQAERLCKILAMPQYYYFRFAGALAQFVVGIKNGYTTIPSLMEYSDNIIKEPQSEFVQAIIVSKLQGACFVEFNGERENLPENLLKFIKDKAEGDNIKLQIVNGKIKNLIE